MSRHIKSLDGLRGIAIIVVLTGHLLPYHASTGFVGRILNGVAGLGWSGVSLFFVLSGFLITGILFDSKSGPRYFRNFYARRALRIFPLYYLIVTLCLVVLPLFQGTVITRPTQDAWMYWVFLSNYHESFHSAAGDGWLGPLWSLAVEEHFYLVWPAIIFFCSRRSAIFVSFGAILLALAFRLWFVLHGNIEAPYVFTLCRMDDLAEGALIALLLRGNLGRKLNVRYVMILAIVSGVAGMALTVWKHAVMFNPVLQLAGLPVFALFFSSLLILAITPGTSFTWKRILESQILRFFGRYSYALYIFHPAVDVLMPRFAILPSRMIRANDWIHAVGVLLVTIGVALLSWNLYEKHFLKLKRFFESQRRDTLHEQVNNINGQTTRPLSTI